MKFLLDENQSPRIAGVLDAAGHDTVHVREIGLGSAPDDGVLASALESGRVIVSADTDFGELLAALNAVGPSILLLRRQGQRRAREIAALILANLDEVAADLESGAVVVLDDERIRVRTLPFRPD